jgi:hypothetical protein
MLWNIVTFYNSLVRDGSTMGHFICAMALIGLKLVLFLSHHIYVYDVVHLFYMYI